MMRGSVRDHLPALVAAAALGSTLVAAAVIAVGVEASPSRLQLFLGRLHPLVVHLPIGFVILAVLLEALGHLRWFERVRAAVPFVLVLSAESAVIAVLAGYLLDASGGYDGATVMWHKRFGIGVAVGSLAASAAWYATHTRPSSAWLRRAYTGAVAVTVALLMAAGHLGGTLTHGPEYLTEYMPGPLRAALALLPGAGASPRRVTVTRVDEAVTYEHLVRPVLEQRCVACHGPDKQNGGLRLDTPEAILEGGESGPVLKAGQAAESELIRRIWLPQDHEDHMPPRGRKPLTVVEAELLRWWIDQGASFEQTMAEVRPPPSIQAKLEEIVGPLERRVPPVLLERVAAADSAAVRVAREQGVSIRPLADGTNFLQATCVNAATACGREQVEALVPLAEQIAELDLGGSRISDRNLAAVGRLRHLTRLHLERTRITDAGLAYLARLGHLEYLNLYGTAVSDAGLEHLAKLKKLRSLHLWTTAVTPAAADRLSRQLARLRVTLGMGRSAIDSLRSAAEKDSAGRRAEHDYEASPDPSAQTINAERNGRNAQLERISNRSPTPRSRGAAPPFHVAALRSESRSSSKEEFRL